MEKDKRPRRPTKRVRRKKKKATVPRPPATIGGDVPERQRPALDRLLRLLRTAVGALLDVADAAAGAITNGRDDRGTKGATP